MQNPLIHEYIIHSRIILTSRVGHFLFSQKFHELNIFLFQNKMETNIFNFPMKLNKKIIFESSKLVYVLILKFPSNCDISIKNSTRMEMKNQTVPF